MKKFICILIILLSLQGICPAGEQFHFIHYNKERSGLCYDGIRTMLQDSHGYLWVGTHNGLSCFDGRQFSSFGRRDFGTGSDYICALCEDADGRLWIGTDEGVVIYNHKDRTFTPMSGECPSSRVFSIVTDSRGTVWAGTRSDGLWRMDPSVSRCERISQRNQEGEAIDNIYRIASDRNGNLYFCSYCDNLYCRSGEGDIHALCADYFRHDDIEGIACGPAGSSMLYVASKRSGLCAVNTENGSVDVLLTLPSDQRPVNLTYKGRFLYLCTTGGLFRYDLVTSEVDHAVSSASDPFSLSDNFVTDAYIDSKGGLWVATAYEGLNFSSPVMNRFSRYYRTSDGASLTGASISGFAQSSDGTVWIATENRGLLRFDPDTESLESVTDARLPRTIMAICIDGDNLWLGYHDGLCRFNLNTSAVRNFTDIINPGTSLSGVSARGNGDMPQGYDNRVVSIYRSNEIEPRLYVSTTVGVAQLDPDTDSFRLVEGLEGVTVEDMKIDASGLLWLASYSQGLYVYDLASRCVKNHFVSTEDKSGIPEMLSCVCIDGNGSPWIVSFNGGVFHFNSETSVFEPYNRSTVEGIETDIMLAASFDFRNRLWIASDDGLILFEPSASRAVTFDYSEGLLDSQFKKSSIRLADGRIMMGNKDGFILYDPSVLDGSGNMFQVDDDRRYMRLRKAYSVAAFCMIALIALVFILLMFFHQRALKRQKKLHQESEQAMMDELYHEKMAFFASVIHEIKTPLTLIRTPLQNLMASAGIEGDGREDLELIGNSTDYLDRLVKELLDFITVEEHGYVLDFRNIDLIERVGFICSNYLESARSRNLAFSFDHEDETLVCAIDAKMLLKIVNNLLHNALKYAESYIKVDLRRDGDEVVITVMNDGDIIPPDRRESIFKPFVHYDANEEASQSFGIGLPLALKLAQLHGGSLELSDSTEYTGFVVRLPYRLVDEMQEDTAEAEEVKLQNVNQPIILIVEDNGDLLHYLKRKLSGDYIVLGAQTGEKALEKLGKHKVDLLITDIGLPAMDGAELCSRVNASPDTAHLPIIVLSAISDVRTKIRCMEAGASMYIEKPFSLDYLQTCISSVLEKRKSIKSAYAGDDSMISRLRLELPDRDDDFIRRLDQVIDEHISEPDFTNRQIEEALFVSRSSLARKIKVLLGTTPNDYIRSRRLELAAKMLSRGGVRVSEVCYAVGFNSPSYFAKCFKDKYGKLPAEYSKDAEKGKL